MVPSEAGMSKRRSEAQIEHKDCAVCTEQITEPNPRNIGEDHVCTPCVKTGIVPLFHAALMAEHNYPPKYGSIALNISDFADVFEEAFILRYKRLEVEYSTPISDRIYCTHQIYAACAPRRGDLAQEKLALEIGDVQRAKQAGSPIITCSGCLSMEHHALRGEIEKSECWRCRGVVCNRCRLPLLDFTGPHGCTVRHAPIVGLEAEGQKRGVDFQTVRTTIAAYLGCNSTDWVCSSAMLCPSCSRSVGLLDGCNAVTCVASCMTEFCFCCGIEVDEDSSHWTIGESGCPRYGSVDKNPIFDNPEPEDVIIGEPIDSEDEEELRFAREVDMLFDFVVRWILDRIAWFGRADTDLFPDLRERRGWYAGRRFSDPIAERVIALWEDIDSRWTDHEWPLAVLQEMGAPWFNEAHITDAELENFNKSWRSSSNPAVRLRGVPSLLLENIRVLQTRRELRFDASGEAQNDAAIEFSNRHEVAERALEEVGWPRLEEEFPLMAKYWHYYLGWLEGPLRDVLMPQFALLEEARDFRRDPEVADIYIEQRLYLEHGWESLIGHEIELLPHRLNKQLSMLDNDDGDANDGDGEDEDDEEPLAFSVDWMPLNKKTVDFLIEHIEIVGIMDQIPRGLVDRLPLLQDHWTEYFDSLPPGLDESVTVQLPHAPGVFTWLLVQ